MFVVFHVQTHLIHFFLFWKTPNFNEVLKKIVFFNSFLIIASFWWRHNSSCPPRRTRRICGRKNLRYFTRMSGTSGSKKAKRRPNARVSLEEKGKIGQMEAVVFRFETRWRRFPTHILRASKKDQTQRLDRFELRFSLHSSRKFFRQKALFSISRKSFALFGYSHLFSRGWCR